jgi:hypothetical protein
VPDFNRTVEFSVQEEDTDGNGNAVGWLGWSHHETFDHAVEAMNALPEIGPHRQGRLRVARVTTEELLVREGNPAVEAPVEPLRKALRAVLIGIQPMIPDNDGDGSETSFANLRWMVERCLTDDTMPVDKVSRWVGFIQGVLAVRGLLSVAAERDRTRPLFHAAYRAMGIQPPESMQR